MAVLFRSMRDDGEGRPLCGPTARTLGVRPAGDVVVRDDGTVEPGTGGMSVAIDRTERLPAHRRPQAHGGWGPDPVWRIEEEDLPETLVMRRDPNDPSRHGFVEPVHAMTLQEYQEALATSRGMWVRA
jgi:hypothetical protein